MNADETTRHLSVFPFFLLLTVHNLHKTSLHISLVKDTQRLIIFFCILIQLIHCLHILCLKVK